MRYLLRLPFSFLPLRNYNRHSPQSGASVDGKQARPGMGIVPERGGSGRTVVVSPSAVFGKLCHGCISWRRYQ